MTLRLGEGLSHLIKRQNKKQRNLKPTDPSLKLCKRFHSKINPNHYVLKFRLHLRIVWITSHLLDAVQCPPRTLDGISQSSLPWDSRVRVSSTYQNRSPVAILVDAGRSETIRDISSFEGTTSMILIHYSQHITS